jgi:hypothetical protein
VSDASVTYLVGACCGVLGLCAFLALVVVPAFTSYRRIWERVAVLVLSGYLLAALVGIGAVLGYLVVTEWPRVF